MSLINKENQNAIVLWAFMGLVTVIGSLVAWNARTYVEDIAADVYKEQGLPPSETKERLTKIEGKLSSLDGDIGEVREQAKEIRQDVRALIQSL